MAGSGQTGKIVVIGSGSYVFSLSLLHDLIVDHRLQGAHLVLVDLDADMAQLMARVAEAMAREQGVEMTIGWTTDRQEALVGASYVTCAAATQIRRRWQMDREVLQRHGIREVTSECGGVGGLSYALRSIWLVLSVARDMEVLCPKAWLLNVTNPLPRVVTAVLRHTRIRCVGLCNAAWGGYGGYAHVARLVGYDMKDINVVSAGLNHFSWLLAVRDRYNGTDLMGAVKEAVEGGAFDAEPLIRKWWTQFGALPLAGVPHTGEFLPFDAVETRETEAHHGTEAERARRKEQLREVAEGRLSWRVMLAHRSWERPADLIHSFITGTTRYLDMVNTTNRGAIANLPEDAVVEVPAVVRNGEVHRMKVGALPDALGEYCTTVSTVHTLIADAAARGDRSLLEEAVLTDPAITEKRAARKAVDELLRVHADLLPQFAA